MLPVGGTLTLTALDPISWESSDPTIASIVPTGRQTAVVIGLAPGTVVITVTGSDGKGLATITVIPLPAPNPADQALAKEFLRSALIAPAVSKE